jgi:DNA polymerase
LSAIEGRVLAWLSGEAWKVKAYREFDEGTQPYDMYVLTYAKTFRIAPEEVTRDQRQMGKVLELALGYGGGVGAFMTFANTYNMDLESMVSEGKTDLLPARILAEAYNLYDTQKKKGAVPAGLSKEAFVLCDGIKRMWREANPNIVSFWGELEDKTKAVVGGFGGEYGKGVGKHLIIDRKGPWLCIQLPSGRYLSYPRMQLSDGKLRYQGMNTYSRKWDWLNTYGGKLAENVTQAVARDILM